MFSAPVGNRAPCTPSPNWTVTLPSAPVWVVNTLASRAWPSSTLTSCHSMLFTQIRSVLMKPIALVDGRNVTGGFFSLKIWLAWLPSPLPRISSTLSPWVAAATLPSTRTLDRL